MNNKQFLSLIILASFILHFSTACQLSPDNSNDVLKYSFRLIKQERMPVSPLLLGFNAVYAHESDLVWSQGKIEGYLKEISTSVMRYPGGTVTSFYHWNALTGEGWNDSWDPDNPVTPKPGSEFMDLDEFISLSNRINITPLLGINMSSGKRWQRQEDGIKEALDLMKYCKDKNFAVKYWYLDNEPYQSDSNGGSKTIEEYAILVNQYAVRMKEFDPDIKIIVNWNAAFKNRRTDYQKLFDIAGSNIDIVDVHWYWNWTDPTFQKWLSATPMELWTGDSYLSEIAYFRQMVKDFGYPGIKLASLEWNVGPVKDYKLTPQQCALIQSEMLMQFISGGLDIATFWPLQWPSDAVTTRSFVRRNDIAVQPVFPIFKFLGKIQGGSLIKAEVVNDQANVLHLVAVNENETIVRVCFLNKNEVDIKADIESDLFNGMELSEAQAFVLTDKGSEIKTVELSGQTDKGISFVTSGISLTMLTFEKK